MPQAHKAGTKAISIWLTEEYRNLLKQLVNCGEGKDQSDFIRKAIKEAAEKKGLKK